MKQKVLSILALLMMTATGAWAQKDTPLTLEAKGLGQIVIENPPAGMKYKKNNEEKKTITADDENDAGKIWHLNVDEGDKVQFFGNGTSIKSYYDMDDHSSTIIGEGTDCYIYGNIMSLVDEENFATATELTADNAFSSLFYGCTNLYSHDTKKLVLPATTLTRNCYSSMFFMCKNLTVAPELPATTLADECYTDMFYDCEKLTAAPALPATTLARYCYYGMFSYCTSLTTAPALPATTLESNCYNGMFSGCTSLTTAPELPATTLADRCYMAMFSGCYNLTTAPELPAATLADCCYMSMFSGCEKLNSVTCLATNISASNATTIWLNGVPYSGTFTKAAGMTGWTSGSNGIPSGWTVVDNVVLTDGSDPSDLKAYADQLCAVTYKRSFTADKPSTVCLPFAYAPKTGEKFYTFTGITLEGNEYVATMTEYTGETLEANTPYLYKAATTGDTDFSGTYTIPATIAAGTTPSGDWTFVGNYAVKTWDSAPTGIYGFSGKDYDEQGISQGQFVKVGENVSIAPMRCYLEYRDGAEDYQAAPQLGRRAGIELPQSIRVRLVNANGEVTSIGEEISVKREDAAAAGWYMLDGRKLSTMPTQKGIYIVNGKKVVIK